MKYTTCLLKRYGKVLFVCVAAAVGATVMLGSTCAVFNKAPTVPVISGPSAGVVGVPVTFKATATDPESDSIAFQFDWGDTTTPGWSSLIASDEILSVSHAYSDSGTFSVRAKAKDKKGKESSWCDAQQLGLISSGPAYPDSVFGSVYVRWVMLSCAMSPDGALLCVGPGSNHDSMTVLRLPDRTLLPCFRVGSTIGAMVFASDSRNVYASSWGGNSTFRVDVSEGRAVDSVSGTGLVRDLALAADGSRLFACAKQNVYVMRTDSLAILDSIRLPYNVESMVLDRQGTTLYVCTLHGFGAVDVPGCSLRAFTQAIDQPSRVLLLPDEESLYVYNETDSGIAVMRTRDLSVTRSVNLHVPWVSHMERTPDGAHLFVGCGGTQILDTRTLLPVGSVNLPGTGPLAMHPSGDSAYLVGGSMVYVIGNRH